jgi:hypothetical protein
MRLLKQNLDAGISLVQWVGGRALEIPLKNEHLQDIYNPDSDNGLYGDAKQPRPCTACSLVSPNTNATTTIQQFREEHGGYPGKERPVPRHVIIGHHGDACPNIWKALDRAFRQGKIPVSVVTPVAPAARAQWLAASEERAKKLKADS